jgi:oxygen-independent coproporphyrinogen-3 oxidase
MNLLVNDPISEIRLESLPPATVDGLYVHIPFCFHKCHYCDFYSITRQTPARMDRFVDLLLREAGLSESGPNILPKTVFFGGGTPSLLPLEQMQRLIRGLRDRFDFAICDEWTVEVNPATVNLDYCQMLRAEGITRISMGAQSFNPAELAILERHHVPEDVSKTVELARRAGFNRINVDLIYAIPGQSLWSWMQSLDSAIALQTEHLSCYGLTFEPNTPMGVKRRLGQIRAIDQDLEIEMLRATRSRLLEKNMPAYEISNYAKPSEECRHNLLYWNGGNYLGLGPSAASHMDGIRWRNRPHLGEWESAVEAGRLPAIDVEKLTPRHRAGELAMLQLRLSRGMDLREFSVRTGYDACEIFADPITRYQPAGLLENVGGAIRITEKGLIVADSIASEFLQAAQASETGQAAVSRAT